MPDTGFVYISPVNNATERAQFWLSPEYTPVQSTPRQLTLDAASEHRFDIAPYSARRVPLILSVADENPDTAFGRRQDLIDALQSPGALYFRESGSVTKVLAVAGECAIVNDSNTLEGETSHFTATLEMILL